MLTNFLWGLAFGLLFGVLEGVLGKYWKFAVVVGIVISALVILVRLYTGPSVYLEVGLVDVLANFFGIVIGSSIGLSSYKSAVKALKGT